MPESMSVERRKLLRAFGAELVLTPKAKGMKGAVEGRRGTRGHDAERLDAEQFDNPANPRRTTSTTGPEIGEALGGHKIGASSRASARAARSLARAATSRSGSPAS